MSRTKPWILTIVLLVAMLFAGTVGMAGVTVVQRGMIRVRVDSGGPDGGRVAVAVPAALVELAIFLAPVGWLADEIPADEIRPYLPAIREMAKQIEQLPDGVFVRVNSPGESVHVEKRNGRFVIRVVSDGESVNVNVPASTLAGAMRKARRLI